jgi:integrase
VAALNVDDVRPLGRHWIIDISEANTYVRIPEVVVGAVERLKEQADIDHGPLWRPAHSRESSRLSPDGVYKAIRKAADRAGLDKVNIDTLRRSGLRLMYRSGASVQQLRAHARLKNLRSLAHIFENTDRGGTLHNSAIDHLEGEIALPENEN